MTDDTTKRERALAPKIEIDVQHEESGDRGAFFFDRNGERMAEMTYRRKGSGIVVDHTEVSPRLQGLGVGRTLLDALVAWARSTGTKVSAACPYAKAQFEKDPSIRDVL